MLKCLIVIAVLMLPGSVFCQLKEASTFGKIDKADLQRTTCSYDKDAEAEVLSDVGDFTFEFVNDRATLTLHKHVRIKILNDKGLDRANIKISYRDRKKEEMIANLTAATYNLDESGNIAATKLDKSLVYDKRLNPAQSEKVFTMPNVKVGSVIEYKYTINNSYLRTWYLQSDIPVRYSNFTVEFPSAIEIYLKPFCSLPYTSKDQSEFRHTIKNFSIQNVPALRDENFKTCDDDYLQKIQIWPVAINTDDGMRHMLLRSWTEKTKDLLTDESFGTQLKKSIPRTDELDQALKQINDPYQKMTTIYNYVRKNMTWDGEENFYASTGVKAAWKDKKGTAGEINLILVNLLKDAGLNAYPMMVSTHKNGVIASAFPDFSQFNKVLALIKIQDKQYVLDGTDKYTPAGLIPEEVMNTEGMVIDESNVNKYWWAQLWDETRMTKDIVAFQAEIKENGDMDGHAMIRSLDYSRVERARIITEGKEKYINKYCISYQDAVKVDSLELENVGIDSVPLIQKFAFHTPVNKSGEYSYFSANLFSGMPKNPFISDTRFSDVFFGTNQSHMIVASIRIPNGYEFEELPKNTRISLEDKSLVVTRMVAAENGVLNTRITLEYKRPFYTTGEYPQLKEFYKKMYSLLDEQFVIKKKA
jgi:hypothetical protein